MGKKKLWKKIAIPAAAILVVAVVVVQLLDFGGKNTVQASTLYTNQTVETRDLTLTLSGTGSLSPADSYTVTTLISGDIVNAPFEEGQIVEKGTLLYQIDSKDAATSIEQAELSLAQSERSYNQKVDSLDDLKIKASETGEVIELSVKVGDKISAGQTIATIRNSATMSLVIPFGTDDTAGFYIGQSAQVTLDGSFEVLTGVISEISGVEERLDGNKLVKKVTIEVANPGGIAVDQAATAIVGDIACNASGTFAYKAEKTVTASVAGEVSSIHVKEGDNVSKDQLMVTLSSDTLTNEIANSADSVRNSELSLQNKYDQLDNYSIDSPISGTIIEKTYKAGDTVEGGKTLCTIFDLSYLTMTLNVDELDIGKVSVGQSVDITAEALPDKTYKGTVTKVNINGVATNGVTSYPVTIQIDETQGLLPGMNVQAAIVVSQSKDAVAIPVSALSRGDRVLVKTESSSDKASKVSSEAGIPEGFTYVTVTTGINDGEYIEITSGLKAGDTIAFTKETIPEATTGMTFGGGGGMPSGQGEFSGGGGGMPSGGPSGQGGMGSGGSTQGRPSGGVAGGAGGN